MIDIGRALLIFSLLMPMFVSSELQCIHKCIHVYFEIGSKFVNLEIVELYTSTDATCFFNWENNFSLDQL